MNEDMEALIKLVRSLVNDAGAYHSALELCDLDGVAWRDDVEEVLARLEGIDK